MCVKPVVSSSFDRHTVRFLHVAACLFCLAASPLLAESKVALSPEQMHLAGRNSLQTGNPAQALALADALVSRDGEDMRAHMLRARALRAMNRMPEAKNAARAAWDLAQTDSERFAASMVMAQVLSTAGQKTYAQLWLRRAIELAPHDQLERLAIRDFKYLRAANPWSTRLSFAITPDSNINNGSAYRSSFLNYQLTESLFGEPLEYQLSGAALALSGVEFSAGIDTRYRFWQSEKRAQDLFLSVDYRHYELTEDAKTIAPGVSGSEFDFASVFLGYGYRGFTPGKRGEFALRADIGQAWYGYEEFASYLRASALHSHTISKRTRLNVRVAGERQFGIRIADVDTLKAELWSAHFFPSGRQLRLILSGALTDSPAVAEEFVEMGVATSLALGKVFDGADLQLGLGFRAREYDVSPHSADGRQDRRLSASLTMIFTEIDYFGFNPTMTLYAQHTDSNIALYENRRIGINFGIQSAF